MMDNNYMYGDLFSPSAGAVPVDAGMYVNKQSVDYEERELRRYLVTMLVPQLGDEPNQLVKSALILEAYIKREINNA